jgi:carboxyl-terminal processing protease
MLKPRGLSEISIDVIKMPQIFSLLLIILLITALPSLQAAVPAVKDKGLVPTSLQKRATEIITSFISNYHYKRTELDDSLSAAVLDKYLEAFDSNRSYFLLEDIQAFSVYRHRLDDALKETDLRPAFEIFKVFRKRIDERVSFAKDLLVKHNHNFDIDEDLVINRNKLPWAASRGALDEIWRKRIKNDILSLRLAGQRQDQILTTLTKRYDTLARHTHQLNSDDIYQFFINAYTTSVEPHTAYFSPRTSEDFKIRMSLSLEGIGAVLEADNEYTIVRQIITGGPAARSGKLQPEDRIVGVAENEKSEIVSVVGWRLDDVVDLIRGPKGTRVRLQILPKGALSGGSPAIVPLTRDTIKLEEQAAKKSIIESSSGTTKSRIGVITLPSFYMDFAARARGDADYRSTTRDVQRLLAELTQEGVEGVIMDLRANGGGSLAESIELTGLFIEKGPVVQVKHASGRIEINEDSDPKIVYAGPLAVLVDRHSASASEIFAGAIQDYRRGIVLGEPTFGKGTVQNLIELDRLNNEAGALGQLKTTEAQFFRVSGSSTQYRGIVPDIVFPTALYSTEQGERAQENALPWAEIQPADFIPVQASLSAFTEIRSRHERRIKNDQAFQLLLAEIQSYQEAEKKNQVSLREAVRRQEQDTADKLRRERENQIRSAQKLDSLSTRETPPKDSKDSKDGKSAQDDVLLYEAVYILRDLIDITKQTPTLHQADKEEPDQTDADIARR